MVGTTRRSTNFRNQYETAHTQLFGGHNSVWMNDCSPDIQLSDGRAIPHVFSILLSRKVVWVEMVDAD